MIKQTKNKTYDTDTATLIKQVNFSYYGDPKGYQTSLYQTPDGSYFLYAYGGSESAYSQETITAIGKKKAAEWLANN